MSLNPNPGPNPPPLADGSHYAHIASVDNEGNVSATVHLGPFVIDTTGPAAPVLAGAPTGSTADTAATITFTAEPGSTTQSRSWPTM